MAERKHVNQPLTNEQPANGQFSHEPLITILTVHYNQIEVTLALLRSTEHLLHTNIEILVVDNGSTVQPLTPDLLAPFPKARLIVSPENLGFAGGNNLGMEQAKGDYFLLINNDTEVTPDLIGQLLIPVAADAHIGVVCPKIRYFSQPNIIQYAGYRPLNILTGQTTCYGTQQVDRGQFDESGPTFFAHGAAMLISRVVWERVGGMHQCYFLYYEELDWSHQIRQAGFTIYYQATALIYHKESISVGEASPRKVYYLTRNRLYFMRRTVRGLPLVVFMLYYAGLALPKAVISYSLKGQMPFLKAFLNGIAWNLRHGVTRQDVSTKQPDLLRTNQLTVTTRV